MIAEMINQIYNKYVIGSLEFDKAYSYAKKLNQIDALSTISIMILIIIMLYSLFNLYRIRFWIILLALFEYSIYLLIAYFWRKNTLKIFYLLYEKAEETLLFLILCIYYKNFKGIRKSFLIPLSQILISYQEYDLSMKILDKYHIYLKNEDELIIGIKLQLYYHLKLKTEFSKLIKIRNSIDVKNRSLLVKTIFKYTEALEDSLNFDIENNYFKENTVKYIYFKYLYEFEQYCYLLKIKDNIRSKKILKNLKSYGKNMYYHNLLNGEIHEK